MNDMTKALKLLAFGVSCGAKLVVGSVFVFFLYQNDIKTLFQYSQKEVELLASMINIGLGLGFLPGIFFDNFGPTRTSIAGLILASGSYFLIWSTTYDVPFFQNNIWLMAIYFLLAGFGPGFTLMVCFNTNVINFGNQNTGKVVGILNAFFAGSPSIFATVYYKYFDNGSSSSYRFSSFILMIAILFAAANILCGVFVRFYPDIKATMSVPVSVQDETDKYKNTKADENVSFDKNEAEELNTDTKLTIITESFREESVPLKSVLLNCNFQTLVWAFSFASAVSIVFGMNITVISKSVGLSSYDKYLTIILPICNAVLSLFIGVFSDYFILRIPRLLILIFGCLCFLACTVLVVVATEYIVALMFASGFCGTGVAIIYSIAPAIIKETTCAVNLGRNWGVALLLQSIVGMPSQLLFGAMYDAQIKDGRIECEGKACIVGGMSVFIGVSVLSVVLLIILYLRVRHRLLRGYETIDG